MILSVVFSTRETWLSACFLTGCFLNPQKVFENIGVWVLTWSGVLGLLWGGIKTHFSPLFFYENIKQYCFHTKQKKIKFSPHLLMEFFSSYSFWFCLLCLDYKVYLCKFYIRMLFCCLGNLPWIWKFAVGLSLPSLGSHLWREVWERNISA